MHQLNKIIIIGFAKGDFKTSQAGKRDVTRFQIATNESRKDKSTGEYRDYTEWHYCEAWGNQSKYVAERLRKGSSVKIEGKMEYGTYKKTFGKGKNAVEVDMPTATIRVETISIINKRSSSDEEE